MLQFLSHKLLGSEELLESPEAALSQRNLIVQVFLLDALNV